ncbi:MAG: hypothetical protein WC628_06910 [Candidatus Omnitrophota bacterium]
MKPRTFILVLLLFIVATVILTYPLALKMNSSIAGTFTTDEPFAALWNFWWLKYASLHKISDSFYSIIAAPFGFDAGKMSLYPVWEFFYEQLSILAGNVLSFNIQVLSSFVLSGITMYMLVFYLSKETSAAIFSGIIYAFCPYHFSRAWQHLGLTQIQWMPLYLLTLLRLREKLSYKRMLLCIAALLLVISFEMHYAYFMYVATALLFICQLFFHKKESKTNLKLLKLIFIIMIFGLFFVLPTAASVALKQLLFATKPLSPSAWGIVRPFEDLFLYSAKPLSYFLPAISHPLFGKFTERFIGSQLYGVSLTEHVLYLGWLPLVLAFIVVRRWGKPRKIDLSAMPTGAREVNFYIVFFIFLAIGAWFFSQPPWWNFLGFKIYMPSFFMYKILPMFRAYCRFGIVVMLAVSVLAGFGLKFILEKFRSNKVKIALASFFSLLVLFEFWNWPPYKVIDVSKAQAAYSWIKEQPGDFAIAEYPLDADSPNEMYKFYQTFHEKKIINGTIPGTFANKFAQSIKNLSHLETAAKLKGMGVRYVVLHKEGYIDSELVQDREELSKISSNPGLKFIKNFPSEECPEKGILCVKKTGAIDVYEIIASPDNIEMERKGK